jgi:hypothetical protein
VNHWTDGLDAEDGEGFLVRPYTITGGRTSAERDDLTLITVVTAVTSGIPPLPRGLQPEHRAILGRCHRPIALAEIAAMLDLPVSVTKILIGDLLALGTVTARPPLAIAQGAGPDITLLQAVRDGLHRY